MAEFLNFTACLHILPERMLLLRIQGLAARALGQQVAEVMAVASVAQVVARLPAKRSCSTVALLQRGPDPRGPSGLDPVSPSLPSFCTSARIQRLDHLSASVG